MGSSFYYNPGPCGYYPLGQGRNVIQLANARHLLGSKLHSHDWARSLGGKIVQGINHPNESLRARGKDFGWMLAALGLLWYLVWFGRI